MRTAPYKLWTVLSLGMVVLICLLIVAFGDAVRLLSALILPPFVAALSTTPRRTAITIAASLAAAVAVTILSYSSITTNNIIRCAVIAVGSALALQTAILRERDLRTRRRLALINDARRELEAASGMEDDLASFGRAAVIDFAEWVVLDIRVNGGDARRRVFHAEHSREFALEAKLSEVPGSVSTAYETRATREGPLHLKGEAAAELIDALFERFDRPKRTLMDAMVVPVAAGEIQATFILVAADAHPPLAAAELTQTVSLAQASALSARNDQLIDQLMFAESELRASRDEVAAIVSGIADGVAAQSVDGRMIYANDAAAHMFGLASAEELMGAKFEEVHTLMEIRDEHGDPFDPEMMPSRRALRGEEAPEALLRYTVKATGREWWTLVKARAISDEHGKPLMAISVIEDLTEHRRAELAQRFLADAGKALNEPGDLRANVKQIASACVPAIADWCAIDLIEQDGRLIRHTTLPESESHGAEAPAVSLNVAATGVPEFLDAEGGSRAIDSLGIATGAVAEIGQPNSAIVAPLTAHGAPVGTISLALAREGLRFTEYDLETVLELGRRAGLSVAEARDQDNRARMLNTLSRSLLPSQLPSFDGLRIATRFRPAEADLEVGGDFFDAFEMSDGSVALVIGDVCGKGSDAAALTALARYTIRTDAMRQSEPSAILKTLNDALVGQVTDNRFCTVALARIRSNGNGVRSIDVASGGHPLPILNGDGHAHPIGASGTLLGVVDDPKLQTQTIEFPPGNSIVLYTDGLASGSTTDDTGFAADLIDGLGVRPAEELADAIDEAARAKQNGPSRDDVAILVAEAL